MLRTSRAPKNPASHPKIHLLNKAYSLTTVLPKLTEGHWAHKASNTAPASPGGVSTTSKLESFTQMRLLQPPAGHTLLTWYLSEWCRSSVAEECGEAVGESPSLLMEADNRRDWKKKRTHGPRPGESCTLSPGVPSPLGALEWRQGEAQGQRTTLKTWSDMVKHRSPVMREGGWT